ncbi:hypothetical protein ACFL59_02470 [Planctomycetota bacterium]
MVNLLLYVFVCPCVAALLATLPALIGAGRAIREKAPFVGIAVTVGYVAAHVGLVGPPRVPPGSPEHWLPLLSVAAVLVFLVRDFMATPVWFSMAARLFAVFGVLGIMLAPMVQTWTAESLLLWIGGTTLAVLIPWVSLDYLVPGDAEAPVVPAALAAVAAGGSVAVLLSGNPQVAQLIGGLAVVLGALCLFCHVSKGFRFGHAATATGVVTLLSLLLYAQHRVDLPAASILLLALGLGAAPVGRSVERSTGSAFVGLVATVLAALPAVGPAVFLSLPGS